MRREKSLLSQFQILVLRHTLGCSSLSWKFCLDVMVEIFVILKSLYRKGP